MLDRKDLRALAIRWLAGRDPYPSKGIVGDQPRNWSRYNSREMSEIKAMAEKIKARYAKRSKEIKRKFSGYEFKPMEPKSGNCTYCWPEKYSIGYKGGKIKRYRMNNPKNMDI